MARAPHQAVRPPVHPSERRVSAIGASRHSATWFWNRATPPRAKVDAGAVDSEKNPYAESKRIEVADQYMFGPSILVAPMFAGDSSWKVVLPQGKWFDFYTGEFAGEGATITVSAPLDQMPLFVKDGGIVPMMAAVNSLRQQRGALALEVRHYGTREANYALYDDDGETFDYEKGAYSLQQLRVVYEAGTLKG